MDENLQITTNPNSHSNAQVDALTERLFMFLEVSNWESANNYCERILDIEPTNPLAYLGKLMAEYKVSSKEELGKLKIPLDDNFNYKKIMQFGDEKLKGEMTEYNEQNINEFNKEKRKKKRRTIVTISLLSSICLIAIVVWLILTIIIPNAKYNKAESYLASGNYESAISIFSELEDFKDSGEKIKSSKYKWASELIDTGDFEKSYEILKDINGYEDSRELLREVSWEIIHNYLENNEDFEITVETSLTAISASDDQIQLGYAIAFNDSIKVNATYVAGIKKDGTVLIAGKSNGSYGENSIENVEASGYWEIEKYENDGIIKWDDINVQCTGLFEYNEETMFAMFTDNAYESMVVGLQALLEQSETGITVQDLGFYSYVIE